jgi:hypothetical protein
MTFLSRRKRQIILHASPAKRALTIISAVIAWLALWSGAHAQPEVITPKFVPVGQRPLTGIIPASEVLPIAYQPQPKDKKAPVEGNMEYLVRTELPGPQLLFSRESEAQFYDRIRNKAKQTGTGPAIFPEEPVVSKESYTSPTYPRIDPIEKRPFAHMTEVVEPSYVCHGRLLFEQPNFERVGWNFGFLQPGMQMATFYYDVLLLPYHACSNWRVPGECNIGKCLPGDPAPFTVPIERFSVTGIIGQAGAIIAGFYFFP